MTIAQFARRTGWPLDELMSMPAFTVFEPLIAHYGLTLDFGHGFRLRVVRAR